MKSKWNGKYLLLQVNGAIWGISKMKKALLTISGFLSFRWRGSKPEPNRKVLRYAVLAAFLVVLMPIASVAQPPDDTWQFSVTPYLWAPNIDGTLKYNIPSGAGESLEARTGPNDYLENLDMAFMVSGEVRKGR